MKKHYFNLTRILGYVAGFFLFYEPFSYFHRLTSNFIIEQGFSSIHIPCARIPLVNILKGDFFTSSPTSLFFVALLILVSLFFGPVFCGRLCPAGAFAEFLSRLLPDKFKIDWAKLVPIVPIRYGFFTGFLFSTFLGFSTPCTYCNYFAFELILNGMVSRHFTVLSTSLVGTFIIAFIILGLFTKGGRGYCNFLCPVGALSSLCHFLGSKLPFTYGIQVPPSKCVGCGKCVAKCPMRAIDLKDKKAVVNLHHCITCGVCSHNCPTKAITYGQKA